VNSGVPFQKTTASVSKLLPLTSIVKGTLLTGALFGNNLMIKGGEEESTLKFPTGSSGIMRGTSASQTEQNKQT
jgi:hypothetical protein